MRKYIIQSDTFDAPFMLVISSDQACADFMNSQQKKKPDPRDMYYVDDPNDMGAYYQFIDELKCGIRRVIWLKNFRKGNTYDLGVLIHELQHYVLRTLRDKGLGLNNSSEEAYSYLLESVFKKCYKVLNK